MRVCGTQHEINHIWMSSNNFRQRLDRVFNPLARADQPEGQKHLATRDAELLFIGAGIDKGEVGNAVSNDVHFRIRHAVGIAQNIGPFAGHHHQSVAAFRKLLHHLALRIGWFLKKGVERGHHRHSNFFQQREEVTSG